MLLYYKMVCEALKKAGFVLFKYQKGAFKTAVSQKLFVTLSSVGIASIEVETKSRMFDVKFWTSAKRGIDSQLEICGLAN